MRRRPRSALDRAAIEQRLGLDLPIHVQYGRWISGILLRGTFGESLLGGWRTEERMLGRLPVTAELGLLAILIGLVIALPVGIYSAVRQYTAADYLGRSVAIMGLATPNFWLGTMVMIYPAIWCRIWADALRADEQRREFPPVVPVVFYQGCGAGGMRGSSRSCLRMMRSAALCGADDRAEPHVWVSGAIAASRSSRDSA